MMCCSPAAAAPGLPTPKPVPPFLSSLLSRSRTSLLVLLVAVLPLQGMAQLVAGLQAQRHLHTGAERVMPGSQTGVLATLVRPLRLVLDRLHAGQDMRVAGPRFGGAVASGPLAGQHQHGGVSHTHGDDTQDVLQLSDAADDGPQGGATLFLAWLPRALPLMAAVAADRPAQASRLWRDRVVAPPRLPPRG